MLNRHSRLFNSASASIKNQQPSSSSASSRKQDFNSTLAFPRWTAGFVADHWQAQKLFRRVHGGWLGPRSFELSNQALTKCLLPFYIMRMKILAEVQAEVGFTRRQHVTEDRMGQGLSVCESNDSGFWCKVPPVAFDLSQFWNDVGVDFSQDDPRTLNLLSSTMVFAGSGDYVPIMKQSKQVGLSFFSDIEDDNRALKKIKWEPFAFVDQSRLPVDPFILSPEAAEKIYLNRIRKALDLIAKEHVRQKYLADDVRNVVVKFTVTEGFKEITPVALPFYRNENKWGNATIHTLIDALHMKAYSENLFSPTMAFGLLSIVNWSLLTWSQMPPIFNNIVIDMALPGISAALVAYFLPQVRVKSDASEVDQIYRAPLQFGKQPEHKPDPPVVNNTTTPDEPVSAPINDNIRWNAGPRRLRFNAKSTTTPHRDQPAPVSRDPLGLYKILELKGTEPQDEIFSAYIRMVKRYHPDLHSEEQAKEQAKESFQRVLDAYNILKDESKRAEYDIKGRISGGR